MLTASLVIELSYVLFSLLLLAYSTRQYFKQKQKGVLYLSMGFVFLTCSSTIQLITSLLWYYGIYLTITTSRLLDLTALTMFAIFTITTIIALGKIIKTSNNK
jgi:hypothetical protein